MFAIGVKESCDVIFKKGKRKESVWHFPLCVAGTPPQWTHSSVTPRVDAQLSLDCSGELGNEPFWNVHRADIPRPLFIVTG